MYVKLIVIFSHFLNPFQELFYFMYSLSVH